MAQTLPRPRFPRPSPDHKPVGELLFGNAFAASLLTEDRENPHDGIDARAFNSWAGWCSRKVAYEVQECKPEPFEVPALWNFRIGKFAHRFVQNAIATHFPDAEIERLSINGERAGHMDWGVSLNDKNRGRVGAELKTVGGFGFKDAIANGPRLEHKLQTFLNALDYNADLAVLIYLAKEALSPWYADGCFGDHHDPIRRIWNEWHFTREQYHEEAVREHDRLTRIAQHPKDVARWMPGLPAKARIVQPSTGRWVVQEKGKTVDSGKAWQCNYCGHQDRCVKDLLA